MSTKINSDVDDLLDRIANSSPEEKIYHMVTQFSKPEIKKHLSKDN